MTQEQKLRACFRWVMPFPRADWRLFAQGGKSQMQRLPMIFLKENQETVYQVQVLLLTLRRPVESEMFISAQMDRDNGKAPMDGWKSMDLYMIHTGRSEEASEDFMQLHIKILS